MNQKEQKIRYAIQKAIKELNSAPSDSSAPPTDLYQEVIALIKEHKLDQEQQAVLIGKLLDWDLNK